MSAAIKLAIVGAKGRMGMRLSALADSDDALEARVLIDNAGPGLDAINPDEVDVLIDFSTGAQARVSAAWCAAQGVPMVLGTTGLSEAEWAEVDRAAASIPVVAAPNFSVGVNALFQLAGELAAMLGSEFDLEMVEAHHKHKVDAPSGTAIRLLEVLQEARAGLKPTYGREGLIGARKADEIGVSVIRGGDVVGEHSVLYLAQGERIELTHRASDRDIFARGALRAAKWLRAHARQARRYDMGDVLKTP